MTTITASHFLILIRNHKSIHTWVQDFKGLTNQEKYLPVGYGFRRNFGLLGNFGNGFLVPYNETNRPHFCPIGVYK